MLDCNRIESDAFADSIPQSVMRRLLLLRHAKAERSIPGGPDRDRRLVDRGRADAGGMGAYMATHALRPDRVLVSPAARAQETWEQVAAAFKPAPPASPVERLYDATAHTILDAIREMPDTVQTILIVGHNPGLHELALLLVASGDVEARERLREKLPTSGLVSIDFAFDRWNELHPRSGRLERFVTPRSLSDG